MDRGESKGSERIKRYFIGISKPARYHGSCPNCGEYISQHHLDRVSRCSNCRWRPGLPILRLITHWPNYRQIRKNITTVFWSAIKITLVIGLLIGSASILTGGYKDANSVDDLIDSPGEETYPYDSSFNNSAVEAEFIRLLNDERTNRSLQPVTQREQLTQMGIAHSKDMAKNEYVGHVEPDGDTIADRYQSRGLLPECRLPTADGSYYMGAENAYRVENSYSDEDAELAKEMFESWMGSAGHRKAMLVYTADEAGLGIAIEGDTIYASLELC